MDAQFWLNLGWLGLILVHLLAPFIIFIPLSWVIRAAVTVAMATQYNVVAVILVANCSSTCALVVLYHGFGWLGAAKLMTRVEQFRQAKNISAKLQSNMWPSLLGLAISPVPEILIPLVASAKRYPVWKFASAMFIGRLTHIIVMALGGLSLKLLWRHVHQ